MKILILTSYTVPDYAGGGRNAFRFASFLKRIGSGSKILTLNRNLEYKRKEIINDVIIRRLPYFNINLVTKLISFLFFLWPSYLFHALWADYIYIIGANIIGYQGFIWIGSKIGKKIVFRSSLMGYDDIKSLLTRSRSKKLLKYILSKGIHTYLSINPSFTISYKESGIHLRRVVEKSQGIDTDLFQPASFNKKLLLRKKYSIPPDTFVVLYIGHIIKRKGFDKIVNYLSRFEYNFLYLVVGETEYGRRHFMSEYIKETNELIEYGKSSLGQKFKLFSSRDDVVELYQLTDLFLLGSVNEGTPNSILEAMSCGLPVICSNLEGINQYLILQGRNGYLFDDFESFKSGFLDLFLNSDKCREFGKFSRILVEKDHSFKKLYHQVFQQ